MLQRFLIFQRLFENNKLDMFSNKMFKKVFQSYSFLYVSEKTDVFNNPIIFQNFKDSKIVIIDHYIDDSLETDKLYFFLSFNKTIILINQKSSVILQEMFLLYPDMIIFFLQNTKSLFNQRVNIPNKQYESDSIFIEEINNFNQSVNIWQTQEPSIHEICSIITTCIIGYLIKKGYYTKSFQNEISQLNNCFSYDNCIELRTLGCGSSFIVKLFYYIEREQLFAVKIPNGNYEESSKLIEREFKNYGEMNYFLLPKFYGTFKKEKYLVIEFINGTSLVNIKSLNFDFKDKIHIIFQIMMIINYFHKNGFVYRDLKPDNIIINNNKRVFIIDFDRMIKYHNIKNDTVFTADFSSSFISPEACQGKVTYENDIYSLGQIIYYVMSDEYSSNQQIAPVESFPNMEIYKIYKICIETDKKNSHSISEVMFLFYITFVQKISYYFSQKDSDVEYFYGLICNNNKYITQDIKKAINFFIFAASQNNAKAQFNLALIYEKGKYVQKDINKAIHYYSLAANQNNIKAQFHLALIYEDGEYVQKDINKAIHYYSLAANQNDVKAQFHLALIYQRGEYVQKDINKAIYYYTLAANQYYVDAQFNLALIYEKGKYVQKDINKAIYYYTLAANQNDAEAQYNLALIYQRGEYVQKDINKAIYYYTLAANQDHANAQFNLALIYEEGEYVPKNINKAIYYYTLAANRDHSYSQLNLGYIFFKGEEVIRDITKSIYYYTLAANHNLPEAQNSLGTIYDEANYVSRDINKAIYYYTLAANQNYSDSQLKLGYIYFLGHYIPKDIKKGIYYFKLAADNFNPEAQYCLGYIYDVGKEITPNISKAIHYYTLASNQNQQDAQFKLGIIYYEGFYLQKNIKKAIYLLSLSAKNKSIRAKFALGYLYNEGKCINCDITKAIQFYKEASSYNNQYAKNNLGIIYKKGFRNVIQQNIGLSISYFQEAINQKNDFLAMYNLAHLYIYDDNVKSRIGKSINLLFELYKQGFSQSKTLLCIALIIEYEFNTSIIEEKLAKLPNYTELDSRSIMPYLKYLISNFEQKYNYQKEIIFIYDYHGDAILLKDFEKPKIVPKQNNKIKDASTLFYEGFGISI